MKVISIYHYIRLYLPFSLINLMIIFIFNAYISNYLIGVMTNTSNSFANDDPLIREAISDYFRIKALLSNHKLVGISYSITFIVSVVLMLINLYCSLIRDPGYLDSPLNNEIKLIKPSELRENDQPLTANKTQFVNQFEKMVSNGPLDLVEYIKMKRQMNKLLNHKSDYGQKEIDLTEQIDLCSSCLRWKPERVHHCKRCEKCVLKMDHHCPWLSNCIGLNNYKPFLLTILYGLISSLSVLLTYWEYIIYIIINDYDSYWYCIWNAFAYVCNLVLFSFLFYLFCSNWKLLFLNMTTIEKAEYQRFSMTSNAKNNKAFDKGFYANFIDVFGSNPLRWFLP